MSTERPEPGLVLPGRPGPKLDAIWARLSEDSRQALLDMLRDPRRYNAEWLAHVLTDENGSISASTIKAYRRALAREGELV